MSTRPVLLATCSAGLCNRLIVLAGCLRLAERLNRKLVLYWPENDHLNCAFPNLFENPFDLLAADRLHWLLRTERSVKWYNPRPDCGPRFDEISDDGDPAAEVLLIKAWYAPKLASEQFDGSFHEALREHLRTIRPRAEFLRRADDFALPARCLGVHVRRVDDWAGAVEEFGRSRDEYFAAILDGVVERVPDTTLLVAADNEDSERRLRARFGKRVLIHPKTSRHRDRQGVEEALLDLLLLSRTAGLVGTHYSSFSTVASMLGPNLAFTANEQNAVHTLHETVRALAAALEARDGSVPAPA